MWDSVAYAAACGFGVFLLLGDVAKRAFRSGRKILGRTSAVLRGPLGVMTVAAVLGKDRHVPAHILAWQEGGAFVGGLLCIFTYLLVKATVRTRRILRARRAGALP